MLLLGVELTGVRPCICNIRTVTGIRHSLTEKDALRDGVTPVDDSLASAFDEGALYLQREV